MKIYFGKVVVISVSSISCTDIVKISGRTKVRYIDFKEKKYSFYAKTVEFNFLLLDIFIVTVF